MSRIYGYARCSTTTQSTDAQVEALKTAGCTKVFAEKVSSRTPEHQRIQLQAALSVLEEGDELVLSKLDRIGRTMFEVVTRLHDLQTRGIHVRTLDGLLNTKGLGKMAPLVVGMLTGLAEVERSLIQERTQESVDHRRRTGGNLGGRPGLSEVKKDNIARLRDEGHSLRKIVTLTGVSLAAVQKVCKEHQTGDFVTDQSSISQPSVKSPVKASKNKSSSQSTISPSQVKARKTSHIKGT
jgi:DNA invertase Pin-like site-specific DNA recombinase